MSSMRFNVRFDTPHHGPPHPFKYPWALADSLTGIRSSMVTCLFFSNRMCVHKDFKCIPQRNPEDSNLKSEETMQWVLLYLSLCNDRCY
jgi:hypothetical protein